MRATDLTRRTFIQRIAVASAATVGTTYLAGCGGGGEEAATGDDGAGEEAAALNCNDVSALAEADVATRDALEYVEVSTEEGKDCTNCEQWQEAEGDGCGTCLVVPGPINPAGYCSSWTEKVS